MQEHPKEILALFLEQIFPILATWFSILFLPTPALYALPTPHRANQAASVELVKAAVYILFLLLSVSHTLPTPVFATLSTVFSSLLPG